MLFATSAKLASLRRANDVASLKEHKEVHVPTLSDEIQETIKCSTCMVDKLIKAEDLSQFKDIREHFLTATSF